MDKIKQLCSLVTVLLILSSLAIVKTGEWIGHSIEASPTDSTASTATATATADSIIYTMADGTLVVNTQTIGGAITGFAGKVPLEISFKNGKITGVKALKNEETKEFFDMASAILKSWNGKTIDEALTLKVDAVSGATYSSKAIIGNMREGLLYAKSSPSIYSTGNTENNTTSNTNSFSDFELSEKDIAGLAVVLLAALLPLFVKNRKYHIFQLTLNVIVLGFWCGEFISYTSLIGYMAHGINIQVAIIPTIMLITAFVYPIFGKKTYYCTHVCPFGSLQQLAGACNKHKAKIKPTTLHQLDILRQVIWAILMLCIWTGVWSQWTDYEPFSAFIFQSASEVAVTMASVFFLLSFVITRPYCRFVCPMGTLLKISQSSK